MNDATDSVASHTQRRCTCLILAAGQGLRARGPDNESAVQPAKQFAMLGGKPLLAWSLEALSAHPAVAAIVLVLPDGAADLEPWRRFVVPDVALIDAVGGADRRESTIAGLRAMGDSSLEPTPFTLVHDGARPFVDPSVVDRLLDALEHAPAAIPTLPVTDTLKWQDGKQLTSGPDRDRLASVQTPQAFRTGPLVGAHTRLAHAVTQPGDLAEPLPRFTDDASILEWAGYPCMGVQGHVDTLKITTPDDWAHADAILAAKGTRQQETRHGEARMERFETRTGMGYDVHRLVPGDGVWLCGHFIAHSHRLDGHSDADVGLHALTDALLGAIGEGDIGTHFPPSDPTWKGAASHLFVRHAANLIRKQDGRIVNIDIALIAERPKVTPHREAMRAAMADMCGIEKDRVSVKATTNERMGFTGREEGLAALATASVELPRGA